jgi:hypothetical protein
MGMSRVRSWRLWLAAAGAVTLLAACTGNLVNPQVPPPGSSPGFQDGYVDGCLSGFTDAGRDGYQLRARKDVKRYRQDPEYKNGFDKGYHACFEEEKRTPKMMADPGGSLN